MMRLFHGVVWIGIVLLGTRMIGCSPGPSDERVVEVAQDAMQRQAEQNQQMAELSQQSAQAASKLVQEQSAARKELTDVQQQLIARDAECRQDLNTLQKDVQKATSEARTHVDVERSKLEAERREIATDRQRAPVIAGAISQAAMLLVCALPLAVAVYLLYAMKTAPAEDGALTELLVQELVADEPRLLNYHNPALEPPDRDGEVDALPAPDARADGDG
jgi:hypothetical protein